MSTLNVLKPGSHKHWRWILALAVFICGFAGFQSGVEVSERDVSDANVATRAYYTLGLFILGGMDLGVPTNGPFWGRVLLWIAYFGAPVVTGSTIVDWVQQIVHSHSRWLRDLDGHVVLVGTADIAHGILAKLAELTPDRQVIVVEPELEEGKEHTFAESSNIKFLHGDMTNSLFLNSLRLGKAHRVILASDDDFANFEAASRIMETWPALAPRLLVHCNRLRFLRQVQQSRVARECITFNSYHLAAQHLVRNVMLAHFKATEALDTVVLAGFGRFGQTILEGLQALAPGEIAEVGIIDVDADRRILVAREQSVVGTEFNLHILQGDISHPETWRKLDEKLSLREREPFILLATGRDDENLRVGLWLRSLYPGARIMVRSARASHFSQSACAEAGITTFGLSEIIDESMPDEWFV